MADVELEYPMGYVDKRRNNKGQGTGATSKHHTSELTNFAQNDASVGALRTRLAAFNGTLYTTAKLNQMTKNDMVYALRIHDEAGIASNGSI